MRVSWQSAIASVLVVGITAALLASVRRNARNRQEDGVVRGYFYQLHPIEAELEDVRGNLRKISRGKGIRESQSKVVHDAEKEYADIQSISPVPSVYAKTQQDFIAWALLIKRAAINLNHSPTAENMRQIAMNVARADVLYQRVESGVASDER